MNFSQHLAAHQKVSRSMNGSPPTAKLRLGTKSEATENDEFGVEILRLEFTSLEFGKAA